MAWLNRVSLGNFPDLAGAVNKLSESVKNIERNLGLEDNLDVEEEEVRPSTDKGAFFDPVMNLTRQKDAENDSVIQEDAQSSKNVHSEETLSRSSTESPAEIVSKDIASQPQEPDQTLETRDQDQQSFLSIQQDQNASTAFDQDEHLEQDQQLKEPEQDQHLSSSEDAQTEGRVQEISEVTLPSEGEEQEEPQNAEADHSEGFSAGDDLLKGLETVERVEEVVTAQTEGKAEPAYLQDVAQTGSPFQQPAENGPLVDEKIVNDSAVSSEPEPLNPSSATHDIKDDTAADANDSDELHMVNNYQVGDQATVPGSGILDRTPSAKAEQMEALIKKDVDVQQLHSESLVSQHSALSLIGESESEAEKLKAEMKIKEAALQGAGKQAQVYALTKERGTLRQEQSRISDATALLKKMDEIIEQDMAEVMRHLTWVPIWTVRESTKQDMAEGEKLSKKQAYQEAQKRRLGAQILYLEERKQRLNSQLQVYALTKEIDTLRREQSRKSDATALLKGKDEIIKQNMAEGAELSKKQAARKAEMAILRAQIRFLEEVNQRMNSNLQVHIQGENFSKNQAAKEAQMRMFQAQSRYLKEKKQRLNSELQVYALTKERDTLQREQSRKSDATVRLKEKDEIINQEMAEGEELSKKQAAREAKMTKLRAQIRNLEGVNQRMNSKLQLYAWTKVRDTLRQEQSRKSDATAQLKEKDEIIKQDMAEGAELSKKQAARKYEIAKLRAQIRNLEGVNERMNSKLQIKEARVESIQKDKAATEKALQEAVESSQAELAAEKEFYTNALKKAKYAEARANNEAKTEFEHRLREAGEREATLIQRLEGLMETLSNTERQAASREDELRSEIDHLQRRCQATEMRIQESVWRASNTALVQQISHWQRDLRRREDEWLSFGGQLNLQLQEAEARAASADERERAMNERLSQTLSQMAVLEAQVSHHRAEQAQLARSLEKERHRAAENWQEYRAALETVASQGGRVKQLEEEMREIRNQHEREMVEEMSRREILEHLWNQYGIL